MSELASAVAGAGVGAVAGYAVCKLVAKSDVKGELQSKGANVRVYNTGSGSASLSLSGADLYCFGSIVSGELLATIPVDGTTDVNVPLGTRWGFLMVTLDGEPQFMSQILDVDVTNGKICVLDFNKAFVGYAGNPVVDQVWTDFMQRYPDLSECICRLAANPAECMTGKWPQ